jgi:hypothetical protein
MEDGKETLKVHLYPGQDDELLRWVASLEPLPFGGKSQAIKAALLHGIGQSAEATSAGDLPVDLEQLVSEHLVGLQATLLAEIRRVVEAAVTSSLADVRGSIRPLPVAPSAEPCNEAEALLDTLGSSLLLDDEEDL